MKTGGGAIAVNVWYAMFADIFYTGYYNYKDHEGELKGKHKAMITLEEFDIAQKILGRHGCPRQTAQRNLNFMGLLKCGECGCAVTGEAKTKEIQSLGITRMYTYYHCSHKRKDYQCKQKSITEHELEEQFEREIDKYTILPEFLDLALRLLRRAHHDEVLTRTQIHKSRQEAYKQAQARLDNLLDRQFAADHESRLDEDDFKRKKAQYKREVAKCKELVHGVEERADEWVKLTEETFDFATYSHHAFTAGNADTKKRVIQTLGYNLTLKDKKLQLEANKWLLPIAKYYPAIEAQYLEVITSEKPSMKEKTAALATVSSQWWR